MKFKCERCGDIARAVHKLENKVYDEKWFHVRTIKRE